MKMINYRKMAMTFGGILIATFAAGCYGGGGSGYYNHPYGYNSNYSSYGSSYPYSNYDRGYSYPQSYSNYNRGYSYPQSYGNSYNNGYRNGVRADENRDRRQDRVNDQHAVPVNRDRAVARTETTHTSIDRTERN
jgi:hypothetical protein